VLWNLVAQLREPLWEPLQMSMAQAQVPKMQELSVQVLRFHPVREGEHQRVLLMWLTS
jgi:hypothetical protein